MREVMLAIVVLLDLSAAAPGRLDPAAINKAIDLGKSCGDVPLIKLVQPGGDFDVYVESPFARVAIHAAAAQQMHHAFDASNVTSDIGGPGYHVWLQYTLRAVRTLSVKRLVLQPTSGRDRRIIEPIREGPFQLTAGAWPAHGIITDVRWRQYEWVFDRLPEGDFAVVLRTTTGVQRYHVTARERSRTMRVCN
jgi:hypothetical protein